MSLVIVIVCNDEVEWVLGATGRRGSDIERLCSPLWTGSSFSHLPQFTISPSNALLSAEWFAKSLDAYRSSSLNEWSFTGPDYLLWGDIGNVHSGEKEEIWIERYAVGLLFNNFYPNGHFYPNSGLESDRRRSQTT